MFNPFQVGKKKRGGEGRVGDPACTITLKLLELYNRITEYNRNWFLPQTIICKSLYLST